MSTTPARPDSTAPSTDGRRGPALVATDLVKTFEHAGTRTQVLSGVSLTIDPGEFVAVMGPSGSGKSTLLYCVSGMDPVDSGQIRLVGTEITGLSEDERTDLRGRRLGFVFQDAHLLEALTVLDNILLAASLRGDAPHDELLARARELMDITGIAGLEQRGVGEISGGQQQRVSICRALLHEPEILFGDEPTGALNSTASAEVIALLRSLNGAGMTMLIVTHDAKVAATASRVVFLSDGRVVDEVRPGSGDPSAPATAAERERRVLDVMERHGI